MVSVADDLRRAERQRVLAMSPGERVELTARLAEADLDVFCSAQRVSRDEARRQLSRARRTGRRGSRAAHGDGA